MPTSWPRSLRRGVGVTGRPCRPCRPCRPGRNARLGLGKASLLCCAVLFWPTASLSRLLHRGGKTARLFWPRGMALDRQDERGLTNDGSCSPGCRVAPAFPGSGSVSGGDLRRSSGPGRGAPPVLSWGRWSNLFAPVASRSPRPRAHPVLHPRHHPAQERRPGRARRAADRARHVPPHARCHQCVTRYTGAVLAGLDVAARGGEPEDIAAGAFIGAAGGAASVGR